MPIQIRVFILKAVALAFGVYALLWALAPFTDINLPARLILDISHWPLDEWDKPLDQNTQWLSSIGAGLLAALSVFLWSIVVPALAENNKPIMRATIKAMITWYVVDGTGSIAAGVASNVFFNTIYLIMVLLPLLPIQPKFE